MLHPPELEHLHRPDPDARPVVELKNVSAGYSGVPVLNGVDLKIMPGDFVGLLGPSGSGKTTLLRTILGAVPVQDGELKVRDTPLRSGRTSAGYVPQLETIDWNFPVTVEEVVMMGRTMSNVWFPWFRKQERKLAYEMMERLGIANLGKRHIRQLSGRPAAAGLSGSGAGEQPGAAAARRAHRRRGRENPRRRDAPAARPQPCRRHHHPCPPTRSTRLRYICRGSCASTAPSSPTGHPIG